MLVPNDRVTLRSPPACPISFSGGLAMTALLFGRREQALANAEQRERHSRRQRTGSFGAHLKSQPYAGAKRKRHAGDGERP